MKKSNKRSKVVKDPTHKKRKKIENSQNTLIGSDIKDEVIAAAMSDDASSNKPLDKECDGSDICLSELNQRVSSLYPSILEKQPQSISRKCDLHDLRSNPKKADKFEAKSVTNVKPTLQMKRISK